MTRKLPRRLTALTVGLLAVGATAHASANTSPAHDPAVVTVDSGAIKGRVHDDHRVFWGVPYAAPPVGERRWLPPSPAEAWSGVRDATRPGSACPQLASPYGGEASLDEDCLFLNVTTPPDARPGDDLPVMVWLHGNGSIGSGDVFDASRIAAEGDIVVVTVNYRLGVFGAFGHPDLADSGTIGLQDQRAAFSWVRRNATAFGGDAGNVTAFGVSFGATSVSGHLMSPLSQGLFDKVIMHSGFATMDAPANALFPGLGRLDYYGWRTDAEVRELGATVAAELGCAGDDALECLRAKSVRELLDHPDIMNLFQSYAYGNEQLPMEPRRAVQDGHIAAMPTMVGTTLDEHRTFVAIRELMFDILTEGDYDQILADAFGDDAAAVAAEYPLSDFDNPSLAVAQVFTDRMWAAPAHRLNGQLASRAPVFVFEFADTNPPEEFPFPPHLPSGAYHNADISYLFRDPDFEARLDERQARLSRDMIKYWTSFARHGAPLVSDLPEWPPFADDGHVQSLDPNGIAPTDYVAAHRLAFWRSIGF
ncbi:carboxylesterase/lipase family protein [Stackebrandtia soli]|uniref:carboxylesterase/lipase family protein n=1 Tax=Stackebrandtia soli TaxID=1892856 RepID=UPI0039E93AA2